MDASWDNSEYQNIQTSKKISHHCDEKHSSFRCFFDRDRSSEIFKDSKGNAPNVFANFSM